MEDIIMSTQLTDEEIRENIATEAYTQVAEDTPPNDPSFWGIVDKVEEDMLEKAYKDGIISDS